MVSTVCFSDPPPTCLGKDSGTHLMRGSLPLQLLLLELGLARHVRGGGERPHRRLQSRLHSFMIQCTWEVTLRCTLHNRGCQCNESSLFIYSHWFKVVEYLSLLLLLEKAGKVVRQLPLPVHHALHLQRHVINCWLRFPLRLALRSTSEMLGCLSLPLSSSSVCGPAAASCNKNCCQMNKII